MATATSKVDAVITNLLAAINASTVITSQVTPVLVYEGPPTLNQPDDFITVAEHIQQMYQPHAVVGTGGSNWLIEEILVSVEVTVYRGGDTFKTSRQRCETIVNAIDDAVRNDPTLAGAVYLAYPTLHQYTQKWEVDAKGTFCNCAMQILCRALP
jgi:hypothetical protein